MTTTIHFSGLYHTAYILVPSGSGLPLRGLPADFATDLLAKLLSDGTFPNLLQDHPLGNINQFHGISPNSKISDLSWHDKRLVMHFFLILPLRPRLYQERYL